ncbi:methyl-accepting chemotaxis protein [Leptospira sp. 2 VSF19]|uniref:Methyl-accepting chemotaxis protein n=1 Tax=Leptospira soteropolitanensis TaxID=2950025 RepID=A0AAW5VB53_9LEPT|nr:methyl-accepting chemotaxis protein [Leptospira soteropolitanensis]MCW7492891.1 methyl-accepting chemotaxis protein [Leptospira soteropolitanensis]MCW7500126.1 methyl-accepting chemotaxis protein [Leptospira soteropolitanensis]MCW7522377.1 methyl-accepting chemotaxis protein [Leptospira soteropolitanensis]MCW7526233.1 methyl-accepting chemotaxis protein [Leptospira soteropolitanensis]MCW7529655.1 methyl-accepting chemotaxis protein [Leptospira soteropolitanensis]
MSFPIEDNGKLIGILWIALNLEQVSKRLEEWNTIIGVVLPKSDMNSGFIQVAIFAVVVVILITAVVVFGIFWFLKKRLLPLENSVLILDQMAKGDLTEAFTFTNHDEIGRKNLALDGFVKSIRKSLGEIQTVAEEIAISAEGLRDSSSSFSDMAQGTTASAEEVAASMETTAVSTAKHHNNIVELNQKILELSKGAIQIEKDTKATLANTENITKQAKLGGESLNQAEVENVMKRLSLAT